jgi:hypothetical protein
MCIQDSVEVVSGSTLYRDDGVEIVRGRTGGNRTASDVVTHLGMEIELEGFCGWISIDLKKLDIRAALRCRDTPWNGSFIRVSEINGHLKG